MTTATKAETAPLATPTRAELIEKFVLLNALDLMLHNLGYGSVVTRGALGILGDLDLQEVIDDGFSLSGALFGELWPVFEGNPDLDEVPEYVLAATRSELLVSRIFSRLAASPVECQRIADHFAGLAAKQMAEKGGEENA